MDNRKLNYFSAIGFLWKYIKKHKSNFLRFYFGWLLDNLLSIALPIVFGIMIDEIVYYQRLDSFLRISIVYAVMLVLSCILYFLIYAQHQYLMTMYTLDIKMDVFRHLQKCDAQYMSDTSTGDIITTLENYTYECMYFVIRDVIHNTNTIISMLLILIYMFVISWQVGLFVLIAAPVSVYVSTRFGKKIRSYGDKQRECYGSYISWIFEVLSALRDIRMLGAQQKTTNRFKENHEKMFSINIKSVISSMTADNVINLTNLLVQLAIFTFAGFLSVYGKITIGLLVIIVSLYGELTDRIKNASNYYLNGQERVSYIQHIYDFLNSPVEDDARRIKELVVSDGNIVIDNINFSYNKGGRVLSNLSLSILSGEQLALVGKSGCGKTTLAYMLIGFYKPQCGHIYIDGQDLAECTLKSIRKNIGLIAQDVFIIDGTIKENILLGNRAADDSQLEQVCRQSGIWNFIDTLPDKLDTVIGSKGIGLSGGQKQRIAIARIYLKNPKIIIFDEATSALDGVTEKSIHDAWESVLKNRTSIVIAHRQSAVMICQRAAIIDNGRISSEGSPAQMAQDNEQFRTLFAIKDVKYYAE